MPELEVRLPYSAWIGNADLAKERGWEEPSNALQEALYVALQESGIGSDDDADHTNDYISYFLIGDDVPALAQLASDVLAEHGVLSHAQAMIVDQGSDPGGDDWTETIVELPAPRASRG
jgi:hypothetical protein